MHRSITLAFALLALAAPVLAQAPGSRSAGLDSAQVAAAIGARMEAWLEAYERGDAEAVASLFGARGIYAANTGELLRGREAIAQGVRGWVAARPRILAGWGLDEASGLDVQTTLLRFRTVGNIAYSLQRFTVRVEPAACLMDAGHALFAWRIDSGGEWSIESLIVNQDRDPDPPADACARRQAAAQPAGAAQIAEALRAVQAGIGEPEEGRPIVAIRTPDERFADLPDYPFQPRYVTVDSLRIHYIDEGPRAAAPVVLLHGEPTWSYLYRKMIPALVAAGHRVVAPDLVGFGRSDKPVNRSSYSAGNHVAWMRSLLIDELQLRAITLFGQDWGGIIGLRLVAQHPERFACVVASNTGLGTGERPPGEAFFTWQRFSQEAAELPIGAIVQIATVTELPPDNLRAYDAPFPDERYKAGARVFPMLVVTSPDDPGAAANRAAWEVLSRWEKPFLTLFSDGDPITRGGGRAFQERVPGARGQPHRIIERAGHFLQEDASEEIAGLLDEFIASNKCGER